MASNDLYMRKFSLQKARRKKKKKTLKRNSEQSQAHTELGRVHSPTSQSRETIKYKGTWVESSKESNLIYGQKLFQFIIRKHTRAPQNN